MGLSDAEPIRMYSSGSDETGTDEEDGDMGLPHDHGDNGILMSLHEGEDGDQSQIMDSRMTFNQLTSTQHPQIQTHHRSSTDQDLLALLQSQQASLDKV